MFRKQIIPVIQKIAQNRSKFGWHLFPAG